MRFVLFSVFGAAWIFMWWWTYVYHIKGIGTEAEYEERIQYVADASLPLSFKWSDPTPIISDGFPPWRDSILKSMKSDQILQITGVFYRDEIPPGDIPDLGTQRVKAIIHAFGPTLPMKKVIEQSDVGEVSADIRHRNFPGYRLQMLTRNDEVKETTHCTLIHFPYDSTSKEIGSSVLDYVSLLRRRIDITGESLKLVTLVQEQSQGNADSLLTQWRLAALRDILIGAGIPDGKVTGEGKTDEVTEQCSSEFKDLKDQDWLAVLFIK